MMPARVDQLLAHQVATRPLAPAFRDPSGALSYGAFDARVASLAAGLTSCAVRRGDRVMVICENSVAAVAALFATWRIGATAVPVNARLTGPELDRIRVHAEPVAILYTVDASPDAAAHAHRAEAQSFAPGSSITPGDKGAALAGDIAVLLYTTGTTGDPKGVMLSHDNVCFGGRTSAALRDMTSDDVVYGVLPISHVFGLCSVVVAAVHAGAPVRLASRFDPDDLCAALREDVTLFSGVPQMHALLMARVKAQGLARLGSQTLRYVSSGAAPLDPTWKREAEAFYGVAVQNGYGMTETTAGIAATRCAIGDPDVSVGPPLPEVEITIDQNVPGGGDGMGEVLTRGPHVMPGYFRNPQATADVLREGWMRTGDLGRIDEAGRLHILGRSKELIIHGGFNVYPPEVEAALNDHPQVIQAAVVGRAVAGDEQVLAFCQIAPGTDITDRALHDFVRPRLTGYKRPARIVLATSLPAAPTGKILKHKLLDAFADQLDHPG